MDAYTVDNYGWESADAPQSCDYILPAVLPIISELQGVKRVLDLGSGNGRLCAELYRSGYHVSGVEFDKQGVEVSRSRYPEIPFHNFGVQDDPAALLKLEEPFDVIVSTEVIEHLYAPHLLPRYASAVLRDGGYLVISTPYHGYLKNFALSLFNGWDKHHTTLWHGGHIKFWSRTTLAQLLQENGFKPIGFQGVGRVPYLWKSMLLIAQKTAGRMRV